MVEQKFTRSAKAVVIASAVALAIAGCATQGSASGNAGASTTGSDIKIALSNSYNGNSWRQQMVSDFTAAAGAAKAKGEIQDFSIVNSNNDATQQISQLKTMILQGYKAIVIDAASPTALNGVIAQACAAHITVVVFDSLATAPCAYKLESNYKAYGQIESDFAAKQLGGKGNALEIRGVAGTSVDIDISQGIHDAVAKYPDMKIVGSVNGNWTTTVAQQAVVGILPSLPKVDVVVGQGGDGAGAVKAFQTQHLAVPLVLMGNRGDDLRVWKELLAADPTYNTTSISSMPGMSTIAFWVAYLVATGQKVPKTVYAPLLQIPKENLDAWLAVTPVGSVASKVFTLDETKGFVKSAADNSPTYVVSALPTK